MKLLSRIITILQALAIVSAGFFLFVVTFGVAFGMQTDEHGSMSNCPFMSEQTSVCQMGVVEHIAKWQQLFTATFSKSGDFASIIFLLLAFVFIAVFARGLNISPLAFLLSPPVSKNKPEITLFNYLVTTFSDGILNPRIYEPALI